jgi:hypothetical protein
MTVATDPRKSGIKAGMTLLAASAVAIPLTGTTNETALATIPIPAGAMGLNGGLLISSLWSFTNSANVKTLRQRLGGMAGTAFLSTSPTTNATLCDLRHIRNRNSAASQCGSLSGSAPFGLTSNAIVAGAIDTSVPQDFVITGQLASAGETITLERYEVWLLP